MRLRKATSLLALLLALTALALASTWAQGEEQTPGDVAEVWVLWPKPGHGPDFERVMKEYAAWRKQAGEPFSWQAFQPIIGDDLTYFAFRSDNHHWKDLDVNQAWLAQAGATAKYYEIVAPHTARIVRHLVAIDRKHSYWTDSPDYRYYGVSSMQVRPGAYGEVMGALGKIHKAAVDASWPHAWAIGNVIGGEGGMQVVFPYKSFAGMDEPDPSFMQVLAKSLGSEDAARALMRQLGGSFEGERYTIYVHRPDLSTPE
jgi:hypothetical protein